MMILLSNGVESEYGYVALKKALKKVDLSSKTLLILGTASTSLLESLRMNFIRVGFDKSNIYIAETEHLYVDYIYVSAGQTFDVIRFVNQFGIKRIRKMVRSGSTYIGASAGAMMAGSDLFLVTLFDRVSGEENMGNLSSLELFDGIAVPHHSEKELEPYRKKYYKRYKVIYAIPDRKYKLIKSHWE